VFIQQQQIWMCQ